MTQTREKLLAARDSVAGVLGKRRQTTEAELDECVSTLEELRNACLNRTTRVHSVDAALISGGFDEVIARIKHRPRSSR